MDMVLPAMWLLCHCSYADDVQETGTIPASCTVTKGTYQPRWDTWKNLFASLISTIPSMWTNGNLEGADIAC